MILHPILTEKPTTQLYCKQFVMGHGKFTHCFAGYPGCTHDAKYSKTHLLLNFSKIQNIISSTTRILLEIEITQFILT